MPGQVGFSPLSGTRVSQVVPDRTFASVRRNASCGPPAVRPESPARQGCPRMQDRSLFPPSPACPADSAAVEPVAAAERYELLARFVAAGEQERRRLAEGIHDDSIQAMAALAMRLQMLRRTLRESEQLAVLTDAEQAVQLSIARLRHLVVELHPPGLEQEGLSVALAIALDAQSADGTDCRLDDR